jgi:hypothetical protein
MITLIEQSSKGVKKIAKPAKIYLHNTNLLSVYCNSAKTGTLRETFFVNQLKSYFYNNSSFLGNELLLAPSGDFLVNEKYTIEVGGKNKGYEQIKDLPNSFIVADNIEVGFKNKIPLWMFGFLY